MESGQRQLMVTIYKSHCFRINYLKKTLFDYNFCEKWECDYEIDKKTDHNLSYF